MTEDLAEHLRKILNPADPDYCGDLLDIEDARWLLAALDEARATIARLETDLALRHAKDHIKTNEINLLVPEVRETLARAEAAEVRLRAVVEALMRAPCIETVQVVEEFQSWKSECGMFVRSEDVAAALRLAEGPAEGA